MWSIPNMIPLGADALSIIWQRIEPFAFIHAHGGFPSMTMKLEGDRDGADLVLKPHTGSDVTARGLKGRVLASMKIHLEAITQEVYPVLRPDGE